MVYRIISLMLMLTLLANPLLASDTKNTTRSNSERYSEVLKERVKVCGNGNLSNDEIAKRVEGLPETDKEYFASHPERLQVAGGTLTSEEFILGALFLAVAVTTIIILGSNNDWGR